MDRRAFLIATAGSVALAPLAAQSPPAVSPVPTPRDWSRLHPPATGNALYVFALPERR